LLPEKLQSKALLLQILAAVVVLPFCATQQRDAIQLYLKYTYYSLSGASTAKTYIRIIGQEYMVGLDHDL